MSTVKKPVQNNLTYQPSLTPRVHFQKRESKELVIAYSGPVGSGSDFVIDETERLLETVGYSVERIKLSDYIKKLYPKISNSKVDLSALTSANRYELLQTAGNDLREHYAQPDLLSQIAISKIATHRLDVHKDKEVNEIVPKRQAYLIDQLKHPTEAKLLRTVYGNLFFLVGVLCVYDLRKRRLVDESALEGHDAERIMKRDQKENIDHGQQLDKTLELADYFIRNDYSNRETLAQQIQRFIDLVHGKNGVTATPHEYAMYVAYAAGARSACLSRQVGAAIADTEGNILATGCNDVPKGGGGLYTQADGPLDMRCINKEGGKCFNDHYKRKILRQIQQILDKNSRLPKTRTEALADKIYRSTKLRDLLEFSRSIHAEMDAIVSVARKGGPHIQGSYLYTTTFPCHNCARHIIAAGIKRVYYIQPYEKSLASELHGDDIALDPGETQVDTKKVQFVHFEGVAPIQYLNVFHSRTERKDGEGKAVSVMVPNAPKVVPQYLDGYIDLETKIAKHLRDALGIESQDLEI